MHLCVHQPFKPGLSLNLMATIKKYGLFVMAALYMLAGFNHFWHPATYLKIMPHFIPWPSFCNYITGCLEVLFGALLLSRKTRSMAAWGLIILLILIFPANIQMALDYRREANPLLWAAYLRLPLQAVLIWLAFIYTDWYLSHKQFATLS